MKRALITGSFDPPTLGHIDIIRRAAAIFEEVVVCVCHNSAKSCRFSTDRRVEMLRRSLADLPTVSVDCFDGLVADYVTAHQIDVIVKGVRSATDYEYEEMLSRVNQLVTPVETLFLPCDPAYRFLSSTVAREMISHRRALDKILPPAVIELIEE